jgi:hypothetical protein
VAKDVSLDWVSALFKDEKVNVEFCSKESKKDIVSDDFNDPEIE